jgi:hypothetical protein
VLTAGAAIASQGPNKRANLVWAQKTDIQNSADGGRSHEVFKTWQKKEAGGMAMGAPGCFGLEGACSWMEAQGKLQIGRAWHRSSGSLAVIRAFPGLPLQLRLPRSPARAAAAHPAPAFLQLPSSSTFNWPVSTDRMPHPASSESNPPRTAPDEWKRAGQSSLNRKKQTSVGR